jgi:hypothetical protein
MILAGSRHLSAKTILKIIFKTSHLIKQSVFIAIEQHITEIFVLCLIGEPIKIRLYITMETSDFKNLVSFI